MATFTNTQGRSLIALQQIAASAVFVGSEISVAGYLSGYVAAHFARDNASAPTGGARIRVEMALASSGNRYWHPLLTWQTGIVAASDQAIATHTHPGKVLGVTDTLGFVAGDVVLIQDTVTVANCEFGRIVSIVTNTSVTLEENLAVDHSTNGMLYDQAQIFQSHMIDFAGISRLRAVVDFYSQTHNQTGIVEVVLNTCDSIGLASKSQASRVHGTPASSRGGGSHARSSRLRCGVRFSGAAAVGRLLTIS